MQIDFTCRRCVFVQHFRESFNKLCAWHLPRQLFSSSRCNRCRSDLAWACREYRESCMSLTWITWVASAGRAPSAALLRQLAAGAYLRLTETYPVAGGADTTGGAGRGGAIVVVAHFTIIYICTVKWGECTARKWQEKHEKRDLTRVRLQRWQITQCDVILIPRRIFISHYCQPV